MRETDSAIWLYIAAALGVGVMLAALGVALVVYQRRFLALHREYSKKLIAAHEEERAFVAREVHDDALQRVALVRHDLGDWIKANPHQAGAGTAVLEALQEELGDLGVMLRRVAHRLHPAIIDHGGLVPALTQLADDSTRLTDLDVHATVTGQLDPRRLERDRALILYRIAQEAIRNVHKHAQAKRVDLELTAAEDHLTLSIRDDGRGFDPAATRDDRGLGLISMSERAKLADGRLHIWSKPGDGTTIRVDVPLPPAGEASRP